MGFKTASKFSQSLWNDPVFCNRKGLGLFTTLCDTETNIMYPVPVSLEHIQFAATLLKLDVEDIQQNPSLAAHLVPVVIQLNPEQDKVSGILIGTCGMEIGYGVRHTKEQLNIAHALAVLFIENGDFPLAPEAKVTVIRKWQHNP